MLLNQFNKPATKPLYPGANHLITRILAERPDLHRWGFLVPSSGMCAITVMTEAEVFKGPRNPDRAEEIMRECALLQQLERVDLGVEIPKVSMVAKDKSFYAMPRLRATALTPDRLQALPTEEQHRIADAIGTFNARLACRQAEGRVTPHEVTMDTVQAVFDDDAFWSESEWDGRLVNRLENYLRRHPLTPPMLLHADLHKDNVLYDAETGELAIIDLGAGDTLTPHYAFGIVRYFFGKEFAQTAMESFTRHSGIQIDGDDLDLYMYLRSLVQWRYGDQEVCGPSAETRSLSEVLDKLEARQVTPVQSTAARPLAFR